MKRGSEAGGSAQAEQPNWEQLQPPLNPEKGQEEIDARNIAALKADMATVSDFFEQGIKSEDQAERQKNRQLLHNISGQMNRLAIKIKKVRSKQNH